jgi:ribosomal protein S18 acetylase RimI-like enzyme
MEITIRKLTPALADDYVRFFDRTPHDNNAPDENVEDYSCYCVCWCSDDYEGKDFSKAQNRRQWAYRYVEENILQGYLAYSGDEVVGWCNANTKSDCLQCCSWRRFMGYVPLDEPGVKVKSIFCFVIAPEMQRKGIATQLMERVCADAAQDGFDFVEAYPDKEASQPNFGGYYEMYGKHGFIVTTETEQRLVVRKSL